MLKNTLLPVEEFAQRRQAFMSAMPESSIAIVKSAEEITRSNDTDFPFCQDKNFYYLTGFHEPDALLVMIKGEENISILFCQEKDPLMEVWHGRRVGPETASKQFGFDSSFDNSLRKDKVLNYLAQVDSVHCCFSDSELMVEITAWIADVAAQTRIGKKAPVSLQDCSETINELRLHKSAREIELMRRANIISGQAHQRAMIETRAGKFEYQIEAELLHEFAVNGARHAAYGSIVAGGDNANILHYNDNDESLSDGDLLLIDAGGELAGYAADITRTFPVNGIFSAPQKAIYQLVLDAQNAAIEAIKPGNSFSTLNDLVCDILTKGLYDLGILTGELPTLIQDKACKKYFIHGLGHWLGLDVHDVGDYHANDKRQQLRPFAPGMIMTIEPGIYIPLGSDVDKKWQGIGVRIEDNVLVTDSGHENLTINAPKSIEAIEALMKQV
ncbi:M24 family metallopeptidase [Thalassotalea sp. M1531]|uniref:Xaa-Pro aminopeptidase n=1 Tax=Thalassotalea algicola TaxID=2716224 RepID=A0A7Y0LDE2_9GAMM|nr:aminopeptidase P N-terminal domain-containing protein [Thalassotalea algicola]NMP31105.1 M24 family metallopeptidase [Thalassotalea algicola]